MNPVAKNPVTERDIAAPNSGSTSQPPTESRTEPLLGKYADILSLHGPESNEASAFLDEHAGDEKLLRMAKTYLFVWKHQNRR